MNAHPAADVSERYEAFAKELLGSGIISDPWLDGQPRFQEEPLVLDLARANLLARVGAEVAELYE